MNDEIKEILYVLKHIVIGRASRLTPREAQTLLDYITNLQQENHELKSKLECYENGAYYSSKVDELEQENERLKEQAKKDNHILGCNFASKDKYKQRYEDYKSRVEKAIEYIKTTKFLYKSHYDFKQDLLNILQNGSDEE